MVSNSNIVEEEFIEAKNNWNLDKLYIDLASSKGKALTPVERKFLRGLLCGLSPAEIAHIVYKTRSSSTVRVYLSNGLYKYLEEMLSSQVGRVVKVKNWSHVTHLLEKAGYKKSGIEKVPNPIVTSQVQTGSIGMMKSSTQEYWGDAIDVGVGAFHGRGKEIATITGWIVERQCRLLLVMGMGGIGKTALAVKVAQQMRDEFDYVIWRSLTQAPSLADLLIQLNQILLPSQQLDRAVNLTEEIAKLLDCLRSSRCLIILDGWDAVLDNGDDYSLNSGEQVVGNQEYLPNFIDYRPGYTAYGEFLQVLGNSLHQSCIILTSREKPLEIDALVGEATPVQTLCLKGLTKVESQKIFIQKGLSKISSKNHQLFLDVYSGNPLFIKLVANTIQDLFAGNIDDFLSQETFIFGNIRRILDKQFQRLSGIEKEIIYWLALQKKPRSLQEIQAVMSPRISQRLILEAIELLHKRSLIEGQASNLSLTPVLTEYITESLIEENLQFWQDKPSWMFASQMKSYIRNTYRDRHI